jgi:hypothetical protein
LRARIARAMESLQTTVWIRTEDAQKEPSGEKPRVTFYQALHDRGESK